MPITKIDDKNFSQTQTTQVNYNVDALQGQIDTLNEQIAQQTSNGLVAIKEQVAPLQAQIASLQALIDAAVAAGITAPTPGVPDASDIVTSLDATNTSALAVASPASAQSLQESSAQPASTTNLSATSSVTTLL